ncbi:MAG TPA: SulP family inorganic anion transporter, partial [Myxococcaceae bacterium]|nr:SulP family inorganic anion transporter [Myxococcaceae bacterium]
INIPQVLGYTRIAHTPVVTGLYTVLLPPLAFALFGSSRHLVVAADSATAALLYSSIAPKAAPGEPRYMALIVAAALLTAAMLLVARLLRLGFLADFLARTLLVGFLTGVGIQVAVAMLPDMLGLVTSAPSTLQQLRAVAQGLFRLQPQAVGLSAAVVVAVLLLRRPLPRFPVSLVAVVAATAASAAFGFAGKGISVIGPIPGGLPSLHLPGVSLRELRSLLPVAGSCALIILAQSAAASRAFAFRHGERVDLDADLLGLSAANAAAALSGAFVVNGSPTQTAVGERAGARSQLAQVFFSAVVVVVLLFLTGPLQYLPRCVLAGIVFTVAVELIDLDGLRSILRESPGECAQAVLTAGTVALSGVEEGILLAVGLSLLWHLRHSYRPHTGVLTPHGSGEWMVNPPVPGTQSAPGLIVYRFGADLFYANDSRFAEEVLRLVSQAPDPVRWLVIDSAAITDIDYSAAQSVRDLIAQLGSRGVTVILARVSPFLRADLVRHRVLPLLGEDHVCPSLHEALASIPVRPGVGPAGAPG